MEGKRTTITKAIFNSHLHIRLLLQTPALAPFKNRSSSPGSMFPPSKGTSCSGDRFGNSSTAQSTASCSSPTQSNWPIIGRHLRMAQLGTPSKACQEWGIAIVTLSRCYRNVTTDPTYAIKLKYTQ